MKVNKEVLNRELNLRGEVEFLNSINRIAKISAQCIDLSNSIRRLNSHLCISPEELLLRSEIFSEKLEKSLKVLTKSFYWLNRQCKNDLGESFLTIRVENDEDILDVASEYLDFIIQIYNAKK